MKKVTLNPKRDYTVVHHHPWIFSGAVRSVDGNPAPGETVCVENSRGERLGWMDASRTPITWKALSARP